jgi:hypothetical protein
MNFAIGPAVYYDGYAFHFGIPGRADFTTELKANTIDVTFARDQELGDFFNMEWHVGLRYATFEERLDGVYDLCATNGCDDPSYEPDDYTFTAAKSNESDMIGLRVGVSGKFFLTENFALAAGVSMSALQGTVTSETSVTPDGLYNGLEPPATMTVEDDARSGTVTDFEAGMHWYTLDDRLRFALMYQFSNWDGLVSDLARNPPGLLTPNGARDNIGFSGVVIGMRMRF